MAKNRGRDVSISKRSLPLSTTRLVGLTPLGIPFSSPPIIYSGLPGSDRIVRIQPDVTPQPTSTNRVARAATSNNLYRPSAVSKEVKTCTNRNIRKQVIFAIGKGGRNGMKTARFNKSSKVKC